MGGYGGFIIARVDDMLWININRWIILLAL